MADRGHLHGLGSRRPPLPETPRKLVAYLGLDPRVRQSGESAARHGGISKAGNSDARHMLGEAAWTVAQTPGPLRVVLRARRAPAADRRSPRPRPRASWPCLFWHLLTREQDYAFARPAMTRNKIRQLELADRRPAASKGRKRHRRRQVQARPVARPSASSPASAEAAYRRHGQRLAGQPAQRRVGAGATPGRASQRPSKGKAARQAH